MRIDLQKKPQGVVKLKSAGHVVSLWLCLMACLTAAPAAAYFGPGAGITMLGALGAVLAAIGVALWAILYWPVRAMLRRRREAKAAAGSAEEVQSVDGGD